MGSRYVYEKCFPSMKGSKVTIASNMAQIFNKGPNWRNPVFKDYKIHNLIHSSIPAKKVLDYSRWHQRYQQHHIFRLFQGEENLWGNRKLAARIEVKAADHTYYGGDPKNASTAKWHSLQGTFTILKPLQGTTIFQGYNAMMQGWWADGFMTVDPNGVSNIIIKARRKSEKVVAGASLTGVPVHILFRDNGECMLAISLCVYLWLYLCVTYACVRVCVWVWVSMS